MWKGWKECVENTEEARGEWRRKEAREDRERGECQMRNGRERENQREREGREKRGVFSLSLPPSPARTREGRREAKEEEEYGKGGFAGKTLHGEGG